MDTASHFLIGLGLGAMAHMSPEIATNPTLGLAVTVGTVIASEAPDFDYFYKIKGTPAYFKNHRRWTHSVAAWFLWPSLITLGLSFVFQGLPWGLVWMWCFAAVLIHVGTDVLNTFGAVALLPFSDKRLSLDVLQVFDPVLFAAQLLGILLWWSGIAKPGPLFLSINTLVVLYIAARLLFRRQAVRAAVRIIRDAETDADAQISIMPTFHMARWTVVIETSSGFRLGSIRFGRYEGEMTLLSSELVHVDIERLKRQSEAADTFYSIAERIHTELVEHDGRKRLTLTDLRFRYGSYFPFRAVIELDESGRAVSERLCHKDDMRERFNDLGQPDRTVSA